MMKRIQRIVIAVSIMLVGVTAAAAVPSMTASAAGCTSRFLTFPAWYDGLLNGDCQIKEPTAKKDGSGLSTFIWRIVLNIIEIMLQLVAYASAGFIIYGGYKYLISSGTPDRTVAARKTIINAVIGLIISFFSVVVVSLIASRMKV